MLQLYGILTNFDQIWQQYTGVNFLQFRVRILPEKRELIMLRRHLIAIVEDNYSVVVKIELRFSLKNDRAVVSCNSRHC